MKYTISLLFFSLFLINAKTFTMDKMPANLTPEQAATWRSQSARLNVADGQAQNLAAQARALAATLERNQSHTGRASAQLPVFPPSQFSTVPAIYQAPARRNAPVPRLPGITTTHLLVAAGITYAVGEAMIAYESFTDEEKASIGNVKFAFLVALRTGKNILSRPAQLVGLPSKLFGSLEKKALGK